MAFGVIGAGAAARAHGAVIHALGHRVAAVAARPGSPRLDAFAEDTGARPFTDWRALLDVPLDAIVVATSWDQTERLAPDLARTGRPLLLEKPVALSVAGVERISAAASVPERIRVAYNRRFYEFMPDVRARLARSPLLAATLECPDPCASQIDLHGPAIRDHLLVYKTSHWLDLARHLLGPLTMVSATERGRGAPAYDGLLKTTDGAPVSLHAHFDAPANVALTLHFEGEIWQMRPVEWLRVYDRLARHEPTPEMPYRRYEPAMSLERRADADLKPGCRGQMVDFIESCVEERGGGAGCTLAEARAVTALCEEIRTSSARPD